MKEDNTTRLYRPGDEGNIVQLLQQVFEGWPHFDLTCTTIDHWRWKYLDNPFKTNFIALGISDGRIIGANHAIPLRIKIDDVVYLCGYAADTIVHSDFRRMSVYNKMVEVKNRAILSAGIKLIFSVTRNPIIIESYLENHSHSHFPHTITNLVRIKDLGLQLKMIRVENAWLIKLGFHVARLINDFGKIIKGPKPADLNLRIHNIHRFDTRIDLFWKEASDHYDFIVERRRAHLNWRYCDQRTGDFIVKQAEDDNGRILGYCVLKINRYLEHYPIGYLVDLLALPDRLDVAEALAADAVHYFDAENVNIVNCLLPRKHPYRKALRRYGFLDSRIKLHLFYNSLEMTEEQTKIKASSADKVHFSYGDIDSLPVSL